MTKKFTTEKAIHLVLVLFYLTLITLSNRWIWESNTLRILLLYTGVLAWIIIFYSQAFWLFPKYFLHKKYSKYFLLAITISLVLFLIHSTLQTLDFQEQGIRKHHIYRSCKKNLQLS